MSNPFNQRTKTFGQSPVTGGVRRGAVGPLPAFDKVGYWFDPTEQATVWADAAGTIPITDATVARRIDNKGSVVGHDLQNIAGAAPIWRLNQLNGLPALTGTGATQALGGDTGTSPVGSGASGFSWFGIARNPTGPNQQGVIGAYWLNTIEQVLAQTITFTAIIRMDCLNTGFQNLSTGLGFEWNAAYCTRNAAGDFRMRVLGFPEVTGNIAYIPNPAAGIIRMGGLHTDDVESAMWLDHELSSAEIAALIVYIENKYGTFPVP